MTACSAPAPALPEPTVTAPPASVSAAPEAAPREIPVAQITAVIGETKFFELEGPVTIEAGERLLAVRRHEDKSQIELTAMAPGQARLVVRGRDGVRHIVVDIPDSPNNRCREVRRVPIDGLVEVEHARVYRHVASPAGELHITAVGAAVSFDGPGTLLLMTSGHDGVSRCTRFEADEPVTCPASVTVAIGTSTQFALTNTSRVLLHEEHVTERWENDNEKLVIEGETPGVATLWIRDDATGWQCTAIHVAAKPE